MNKLNKLLQDLKDAELLHSQALAHVNAGTGNVTFVMYQETFIDLKHARAAFEQEKTNLMNTR